MIATTTRCLTRCLTREVKRLSTQSTPKLGTTTKDFVKMSTYGSALFFTSGIGLLGYFYYQKHQLELEHEQSKNNQSIGKARVGGPFRLVDHHGEMVSDKTYLGKYMLIYFGYTFCPDICPEELDKMAIIYDSVVPLFVSCDPKRDSIATIREYVKEFHPKFIGLTGTYNQIKQMAKRYRLYFSAPPRALDEDETDYLVDHSIFFYLVGPDGKFIEHFGRNATATEISDKILLNMKSPI